jgi:hypothetical protein
MSYPHLLNDTGDKGGMEVFSFSVYCITIRHHGSEMHVCTTLYR